MMLLFRSYRCLSMLLLMLAAGPALAMSPSSPDCTSAGGEVDRRICASPDLSRRAVALAAAFNSARTRAPMEARTLLDDDYRAAWSFMRSLCAAEWATPAIQDYQAACLREHLDTQADFYRTRALTPLGAGGVILARQTFRVAPNVFPDATDSKVNYTIRFTPQVISSTFKPLPTPSEDFRERIPRYYNVTLDFRASVVSNRLISLEYRFLGIDPEPGVWIYDVAVETIDLADGRRLMEADIFQPGSAWQSVARREADRAIRAALAATKTPYDPPMTEADVLAKIQNPRWWVIGGQSFGLRLKNGEAGSYGANMVAEIPYAALRTYFTPEFKALIGLD